MRTKGKDKLKLSRKQTTLGTIAVIYATFLTAVLFFHLSIYIKGHYGKVVYEVWVFFYYFTFQVNILTAIWLFSYAITTFSRNTSRFARFIRHPIVITSLTLYVTILFIYASIFVLPKLISDGFTYTRNGFAIFTYLLTPIIVWILFIFENNVQKNVRELRFRDTVWFLVYPTLYFVLNTIIGHTATMAKQRIYENGTWHLVYGRAFAYPQFDPNYWGSIPMYVTFIAVVTIFYIGLALLLVLIRKLQVHYAIKRATPY